MELLFQGDVPPGVIKYKRLLNQKKIQKSHYVDKDQGVIFENTHAPIIDQETFDNVQRI